MIRSECAKCGRTSSYINDKSMTCPNCEIIRIEPEYIKEGSTWMAVAMVIAMVISAVLMLFIFLTL